MPPTSVSLHQIRKMFRDVKKLTKDFREIKPELIENDASKILILRLALQMSQNNFETFVGAENNKNISKYERGIIKKMKAKTAEKYIEKIKGKLKENVTEENVLLAYKRMASESNGFFKANQGTKKVLLAQRKGAINSLRLRSTEQEMSVMAFLESNGLNPEINFPLDENKGIITDIFLRDHHIAIECKDIKTKSYKEHKNNIRLLAYQGYRIKFNFKTLKLAAFVKSNFAVSQRDLEELKGPYDFVFTDVGELKHIIVP
ncbi:MAG: hypothetical protein HYY37_06820 [Candidatus Aenigmarchaeota archaeon]|nr:hypothetical protein [Candidatus Aenigmarchaeota archaeon]